MSERGPILNRIREALSLPAPVPSEHEDDPLRVVSEAEAAGQIRQWLPPVGAGADEQLALFAKHSEELKTDFRPVDNETMLHEQLAELAVDWQRVGSHGGNLCDRAVAHLQLPHCLTDDGYDVAELETCDAGITECDALVAQTGSVLLTARSAGGRALSVLPPHHVVLARRSQMLADLPEAFALLEAKYGDSYPSFMSLVTGPSRTGDIERILVLGAHGPKRLTVFCVDA